MNAPDADRLPQALNSDVTVGETAVEQGAESATTALGPEVRDKRWRWRQSRDGGTHLSKENQFYIYWLLRQKGLIGKVWPVYTWDQSPPIYALVGGREVVLPMLNSISDTPITERQFRTVLKPTGCDGRRSTFGPF